MNNILEYNEFLQLNEGQSRATFANVCHELIPFGWVCKHKTYGDGITFIKGEYIVGGNLKHNASKDAFRYVDINTLDKIRAFLIDEFEKTGDPVNIKEINWNDWNLKDPFEKELKGYDKVTGQKKSDIDVLSKITFVKQLFKNVGLIQNEDGEYNLCRSEEDKRPLLDRWYSYYGSSSELGGKLCLGYDDECDGDFNSKFFGTNKFEIKPDGTLGQTWKVDYVVESVKKC